MGLPDHPQRIVLSQASQLPLGILLSICLSACGHSYASVAVPTSYRGVTPPSADFLTKPANLEIGQQLFVQHCAICHGETGRGDGLAGHTLALKPANLADPGGVVQQPLDYWFWRVSEGGTAEPFHAQSSVMPAWKYHLSEEKRWQVIAYARTLAQNK